MQNFWKGSKALLVTALCAVGFAFVVALPATAAGATSSADSCGYSDSTFNENSVMRGGEIIGTGQNAKFAAFANDENALLIGVNGATTTSQATSNGTNSFHATNASGGDVNAKDPSQRPLYPALFITNVTTNSSSTAGDWQNGGQPRNVNSGGPFINDVFGQWRTGTVANGTYTRGALGSKNNWDLGTGSDTPTDTSFNEGYGAEVRWNLNELTDSTGSPLQAGDIYRIQVIEHDGDQNKSGGDAGEFCVTLTVPGITTTASPTTTVGQPINDTATVNGTNNTAGTLTWNLYKESDSNCSTSLFSGSAPVSGDGVAVSSPSYTPTSPGTYKWVAAYKSTSGSITIGSPCTTPSEMTLVNKAAPRLTTTAADGTAGQPVVDHATLLGGYNETGTITWSVYAGSDTSCTSALFTTGAVSVSGDGDYTSPAWTPSSDGKYQWVATYSGDANNSGQSSGCMNEPFTVQQAPAPSMKLTKLESFSATDGFSSGPITGQVGQTVYYDMTLTNTGNTPLTIQFSDQGCDSGTLNGPAVISGSYSGGQLSTSGELAWTCSHVLTAADVAGYTNTATANATPPPNEGTVPPQSVSVVSYSNTPGMQVVKLQRDGNTGNFTTSQITGSVGDTINYEIQVSNTGNVPLTLAISDPHCDSAPVGPSVVSGTLNGDVLAAGGVAQYTCSHVLSAGDIPQFTNVATVTGTPPSGPPLTGTGIVVANVTQAAIQVLKLQSLSAAGPFTASTLTAKVGSTIYYEIQATNTGNAPLTLAISDPMCDAGTLKGPAALSGTLSNGVLSPNGKAQYTCTHVLKANDSNPFTNTATVTGTPPSGPPVSGTSSVVANKQALQAKKVKRCPTGTIKKTKRNKKGKKVVVCKAKRLPHKPVKPTGFTG